MHTFYWGDWHREHTVGPALADNISPTGWCLKRGMRFTSHHDAPVAFPDSMRVLDATVTRRSRSGDNHRPEHRVDVMTGLKAMTIWPAWQHFEEKTKGSIEVGKLADLVILDQDPTAVDPETLDRLKVVQTIKEGVVVFERDAAAAADPSYEQGQLAFTRPSGWPRVIADVPATSMAAAACADRSANSPRSSRAGRCLDRESVPPPQAGIQAEESGQTKGVG